MSTQDPVGRWFAAMAPHGDRIDLQLGRFGGGEERWYTVPHERYDGIGAILHVANRLGERATRVGVRPPRPPPSPLARARRVVAQVLNPPAPPCALRSYEAARTGARAEARLWWTAAETAAAHAAAGRDGTSTNARLLQSFDAAVAPHYLGDAPALWLLPVSMREDVEVAADEGNYIALVNIRVPRGAAARDVHAGAKDGLKQQEHWAVWDLWRLLPDRMVHRAAAREYRHGTMRRTGTFSNLGAWEGDADGWTVSPAVSRPAPLGVAVIEWNGRFLMFAAAHPAAGVDAATLSSWLDTMRTLAVGG